MRALDEAVWELFYESMFFVHSRYDTNERIE